MSLRFEPCINIRDLPSRLLLSLKKNLDTAPESHNWRAFVALLREPYDFKQNEIERFAMQIYCNGSPTDELILALGGRGMNVRELVDYLDQIRVEKILQELKNYEHIKICRQPEEILKLYEGNCLVLSVEATGFPYPRYQWFRGEDTLEGKTESKLKIDDVSFEDAGFYCCRLHNSANNDQVVFTDYSQVTVYPQVVKNRSTTCPPITKVPSDEDNTELDFPEKSNLPVITAHPRDIYIFQGHSFFLICEVKGREPLTYTWYWSESNQDGRSKYFAESQSGVLQVPNAGPHHSGSYLCRVRNNYGEATSIPAFVTVASGSQPMMNMKPQISLHPSNLQVDIGGMALFQCKSESQLPVEYQWYQNGIAVPGANMPDLEIHRADYEAIYQCQVTNVEGSTWSRKALLQTWQIPRYITDLQTYQPGKFTATDKVALLIGNFNYRCAPILKAPKSDIQALADIFRSLEFKVISLLNLTLKEMEAAVAEFCKMLGSGIYGVFYFVGHGFEENGQCYLVPEDAQTDFAEKECLGAGSVLTQMQEKDPAICNIILDICRKRSKSGPIKEVPQHGLSPTKGNCCIFYATLTELSAYETGDTGILVKYLQNHLRLPIKIEEVFSRTRDDIGRNPNVNQKQIPEVRSSIQETTRSFIDLISYRNGWTEQFNRHSLAWKNAHVIPDSMTLVGCKEQGIVLQLEFQSSFSNVLEVFVSVKDKGKTDECIAWIARLPNTVSANESPFKVSEDKTKNSIQDIQKLKSELTVNLAIRFRRRGSDKMEEKNLDKVNLGLPLVAKLRLWKPVQREPIESTEEDEAACQIYSRHT